MPYPISSPAVVELFATDGRRLRRSRLDGEGFAFVGVGPGVYRLGLAASGGASWLDPRPLELGAGEVRELLLHLPVNYFGLAAHSFPSF